MIEARRNSVLYETPANPLLLELIPATAKIVLDIGCGTGLLASELKKNRIMRVDGITMSDFEYESAKKRCDNVYKINIEDGISIGSTKYDVIVLSHIIEHVAFPDNFMKDLRGLLSITGVIICVIPNMLFCLNRFQIALGRIKYEKKGLMDYTHLRWYTWESIQNIFYDYGFAAVYKKAVGHIPMPIIRNRLPNQLAKFIDRLFVDKWPGLFGYEFVFIFKAR